MRVPEVVDGSVSVLRVVLLVGAAVRGRRGKCLSVHLEVHQLGARAGSVRRVAAAAPGANQTQEQREDAHTWRQNKS